MLKRITLFILAHAAFFGIAAAIVVASTGDAEAQRSNNPYDMRFASTQAEPIRSGPEADSPVIGEIASGVREISLRWCRPEFNIEGWMFGSSRAQQDQLNERVCEVEASGQIGFIPGSALRVQ